MTYSVKQILAPWDWLATVGFDGTCGFPNGTPFRYFFGSKWICFGGLASAGVNFDNHIQLGKVETTTTGVNIILQQGGTFGSVVFSGTFGFTPGNYLTNIMWSVDLQAQILQVYATDAPLTLTSGAGWTGSGLFTIGGAFCHWRVTSSGSSPPGPGVGDLVSAAPNSFFDLTDVSNRRKIINADLTPVDLGSDASSIFGTSPPIYLTVRPSSSNPDDFANNNGTGGAFWIRSPSGGFSLTFEPNGTCLIPPPPLTGNAFMQSNIIGKRMAI